LVEVKMLIKVLPTGIPQKKSNGRIGFTDGCIYFLLFFIRIQFFQHFFPAFVNELLRKGRKKANCQNEQ
jgi:hypothetical protein